MLWIISCLSYEILVEADSMDKYTAHCIMRECYPVLAFLFPVKFRLMNGF